MYQSAHNRVQSPGNGKDDYDEIQCQGERHIPFDGLHHALCKLKQMGNVLNVVIDQRNISRIHGNIASYATHSNADISFFQRRGVAIPITNYADLPVHVLTTTEAVQLIFR